MNSLIRGLMAATALASITTIACAQDQAVLGLVIVLLVSLYGRERHVSATI
ncbi:hypothetical protein [Mesorhizobium sp. M9A.F.Ca.ET.002.03.1.2]|uniref:hypothetical protein n=1 Tax=Mesorhizobium sp. M9A.F.Ca.ET.002.03.1.2 TaxID=2493668 RepID=UPI00167A4770|nr:hypothetical protein [Mesorhizobium sp. M9A.F.Ca.ET.002.03.1.2]